MRQLPLRVVHLLGGLRAVDDRSGVTFVQINNRNRIFKFDSPEYSRLYSTLKSLGLPAIGVEFIVDARENCAPDWWYASPRDDFRLERERRAWSEIRHLAGEEGRRDALDIASRCGSLLNLLAIRILHLSNAYNAVHLAALPLQSGHLFDNTFVPYLEAAIHAFLCDAASLRDLLSEFVWKFILGRGPGVTSYKNFIKKAGDAADPIAIDMLSQGRDGWIKSLTTLRNDVIHVAPIGSGHTLPPCYSKSTEIGSGKVTSILYGLLSPSDEIENAIQAAMASNNDEQARSAMQAHKDRLIQSDDALRYAWDAIDRLIELAEKARMASGLKGKIPHLGPEDIVSFSIAK